MDYITVSNYMAMAESEDLTSDVFESLLSLSQRVEYLPLNTVEQRYVSVCVHINFLFLAFCTFFI